MIIELEMWSLEHTQGVSNIWHYNLLFDQTGPIFKLVRDFTETNILTKFHDYRTENVASKAYTSFFWVT